MIHKGHYLIEITNKTLTSWDGSHSTKKGAEKALYLYERLGLKKEFSSYFFIKILKDVPTTNFKETLSEIIFREQTALTPAAYAKKPKINEKAAAFMSQVLTHGKN